MTIILISHFISLIVVIKFCSVVMFEISFSFISFSYILFHYITVCGREEQSKVMKEDLLIP